MPLAQSPAVVSDSVSRDTSAAKAPGARSRKVAEPAEDYAALDPAKLASRLKALEQQMYQHARDLEFEDAARLRDQIQRLKEASLGG